MRYDPDRHHRRSIRLRGYDYRQPGAYFVTIVTQDRACLFGEVVGEEMHLNELGKIVWEEWFRSAEIRQEIELLPDEFVAMPNHVHGIVWIVEFPVGAHGRAPLHHAPLQRLPRSLASFIAGFKSATTKRINALRGTPSAPVWQRNYYEHIIRDEKSLNRIRQYIAENPLRWHLDAENPNRIGDDPLWHNLFTKRPIPM
ncbi:MAG: transposase [Armatimonadota bacterium]|nr:transposase [Armatimonadota bacterium]